MYTNKTCIPLGSNPSNLREGNNKYKNKKNK